MVFRQASRQYWGSAAQDQGIFKPRQLLHQLLEFSYELGFALHGRTTGYGHKARLTFQVRDQQTSIKRSHGA
jgi:hypothetical protein